MTTLHEKKNILSVKAYFGNEKKLLSEAVQSGGLDKAKLPIKYNQVRKRTAEALSLSEKTVSRICKEHSQSGIRRPKHSCKGRKQIELDSFTEGVIRRAIMERYAKKQFPTLDILHKQLQEDPNFPRMSRQTLWRRMKKQLKMKFGKFDGKPIMFERDDVSAQRHLYLRLIRKYRREDYAIYFTDETWVNENQSMNSGWYIPEKQVLGMQNGSGHIDIWLRGVGKRFKDCMIGGISSRPSGVGKRVIILHIGNENGFLENGARVFIGQKNSADYHGEMNFQHFKEWFEDILTKLPDKSVIVVDQATYHKGITEESKNPTTAWRKQEIIDWLLKRNIPCPDLYSSFSEMTIPLLRHLAKIHKVAPKFIIEELAENCGKDIKIVWLPVAHCELNPIELVWAHVKSQVGKKNTTFKIKDVLELAKKTLSEVTAELWKSWVEHTIKLENILMEREGIVDAIRPKIKPFIIQIGSESESSSDDPTEDKSSN